IKSGSGAPPSPARKIRATAARRPPSSLLPPTGLCASSADRSFTISGCSKSVVMSSLTLPPLLTSSRCRVPYEELHRLLHDPLQNWWNVVQRMLRIERVTRAFDETQRARSSRQLVKALGIRPGHRLIGRSMHDEPGHFDLR